MRFRIDLPDELWARLDDLSFGLPCPTPYLRRLNFVSSPRLTRSTCFFARCLVVVFLTLSPTWPRSCVSQPVKAVCRPSAGYTLDCAVRSMGPKRATRRLVHQGSPALPGRTPGPL